MFSISCREMPSDRNLPTIKVNGREYEKNCIDGVVYIQYFPGFNNGFMAVKYKSDGVKVKAEVELCNK